jgi:hypothetical protein
MDWINLVQGTDKVCCEHGNEPSGFVKCKEFEFLSN